MTVVATANPCVALCLSSLSLYQQQAPRFQISLSTNSSLITLSSSPMAYKFLFPPCGHVAAMCPALPHVQHVQQSPLPPSIHFCLSLFPPRFASLPPCHLRTSPAWTLSRPPVAFARSFVNGLQCDSRPARFPLAHLCQLSSVWSTGLWIPCR